jgi:hypothetical protein
MHIITSNDVRLQRRRPPKHPYTHGRAGDRDAKRLAHHGLGRSIPHRDIDRGGVRPLILWRVGDRTIDVYDQC